ncbi:MAG TPA: DUF4294 domain-containing protein [Chitinophagaceae bacterium]|nr:DUF4294 domain-containing protein [Chitinophagaceae bacterium]HQV85186.1 DUF4294 domain-containing protein [Chitinophagaceae bacterium]HQX71298.1 DUF4294 domain-containing protein [Chitinophagaceae bacterium]HQZ75153.1 DUF4294 domain-containing protein [Chitinophagaceae bacterium]
MPEMTKYLKSIVLCATLTIMPGMIVIAQVQPPSVPVTDTNPPLPPMSERMKNWGPNDTIIVPAIWYQREIVNYKEMDMAWVSNLSPEKLAKFIEEWTRLRNAVYVTYPYARIAGATINDINANLAKVSSKKERKGYIKSREKELKKQFSDPLSNLSVYQGKILMKLINRQTGNNCYEIIKEYKGGLNARFYQTVAFFVGGNLKQDWSIAKNKTDRDIENIVKEIDGSWYNNPYRR